MGILITIHDALVSAPSAPSPADSDAFSPDPRFAELVAQALDALPDEFADTLANTAVVIRGDGGAHRAYGLYHGATVAGSFGPGVVVLFQDTLTRDFGEDPERLAHEIEVTLRHELAHHLGFAEQAMSSLGL